LSSLLRDVGAACLAYQYQNICNLPCKKLQVDEIWSFVYAKAKNVPEEHNGEFGFGDVRTFTAIDADTKLVPCWKVGVRDADCAYEFLSDLKDRLANRAQLTTDGHRMHLEAVEHAFGREID